MRVWNRAPFGVLAFLCALAAGCGSRSGPDGPTGPELRVAVPANGPEGPVSSPFYRWKEKWESTAGARLTLVEIPADQFDESMVSEALSVEKGAAPRFDAAVIPAYLQGNLMAAGYLATMDNQASGALSWRPTSVPPESLRLLCWDGQVLASPHDTSAVLLYFRNDVLSDPKHKEAFARETGTDLRVPPRSWGEVEKICSFFSTRDWNGDGKPTENGFVLPTKTGHGAIWQYLTVLAPFVVNPGPTDSRFHNVFFLDPNGHEPLVDSPGHQRGLELLRRLARLSGDPAAIRTTDQAWDEFLAGRALFALGTGELARRAQDTRRSAVQGKLGCAPAPGATEVYSRKEERFKTVSRPNRIGNNAGPNWHGVVAAKGAQPDLARHLFAFHANRLANMDHVATPSSGVDAGRTFHCVAPLGEATDEEYRARGFSPHDAREYTAACHENHFNSPGWLEYLRLPGAPKLLAILESGIVDALARPETPADAVLGDVARQWRATLQESATRMGKDRFTALAKGSQTPPAKTLTAGRVSPGPSLAGAESRFSQ